MVITIVFAVIATMIVLALTPKLRSVYFSRTHAIDCALRVASGDIPGLSSRWRHVAAQKESGKLVWRNILEIHIEELDRADVRDLKGFEPWWFSFGTIVYVMREVNQLATCEVALSKSVRKSLGLKNGTA